MLITLRCRASDSGTAGHRGRKRSGFSTFHVRRFHHSEGKAIPAKRRSLDRRAPRWTHVDDLSRCSSTRFSPRCFVPPQGERSFPNLGAGLQCCNSGTAIPTAVGAWHLCIGEMVPLPGLEPGTSGSTIRRSNQLSYNGTRPSGAASASAFRFRRNGFSPGEASIRSNGV